MTTGITATTATSRRRSCGHYRILIRPGRHPSRLFPVSQAFQLFYDFHQSLKPPCIVGYGRAKFRVERIFAVLFGEFSYFPSQLLDTLGDELRHGNLPVFRCSVSGSGSRSRSRVALEATHRGGDSAESARIRASVIA